MPFRIWGALPTYTVAFCGVKAWAILARCDCGHETRWDVAQQAAFRPDMTLQQLAEHLVCTACGGREGALSLRQDHGAQQARDLAVYEAKVREIEASRGPRRD